MTPVFSDTIRFKGFTLIEILIVIGLISILAAIVIVAVNPGKQFAQGRDAQRISHLNAILNAVYQYAVDNNGKLPTSITTIPTEICRTGSTCTDLIDLSVLTTNEKYLVSIPVDPSSTSSASAGYSIYKSVNNRVTVTAPLTESAANPLAITR